MPVPYFKNKIINLKNIISISVLLLCTIESFAAIPDSWPQDNSDLNADPNIQYGNLDNGMRFAIMPNQTPAKQASIRLLFDVGSKYERDNEQGMAHFLEHMAFNGSENIPEGEMVKILERLGLAFGADTNASTSYEQTIYQLDLPNTEAETIDTSFLLMREVASNLSIDSAALERERGVILAEKRRANVEQLQNAEEEYNFVFPNNRFFQRLPIGTEDGINSITAEQMTQFYQQFYRPEKAFLVIVGDIDPTEIENKIMDVFGDWESVGSARDTSFSESIIKLSNTSPSAKHSQSPNATAQLSLTFAKVIESKNDSQREREKSVLDFVANSILSRIMGNLLLEGKATYLAAATRITPSYDEDLELSSFNVIVTEDNWQQGFEEGYAALQQILEFGFPQNEVDLSIATLQSILDNADKSSQQRSNPVLANYILAQFASNQVATSPATDLALFNEFSETITPAAVSEYFNPNWQGSAPKLFLLSKEPIADAESKLLASYTKLQAVSLAPVVEQEQSGFAYTNFGAPGKVKERQTIDLVDSTAVRFENNVMLNLKKTDFQDNQVMMTVRFGGGLLSVPKTQAALITMISPAFSGGGTLSHSAVDLPQVLAGKQVSANLIVMEDSFQFIGPPVSTDDILLQLQLWLGFMSEPAYREGPVDLVKRQISAVYANLNATAPQVIQIQVPNLLHGSDPRFGLPPQEELLAITGADVASFLTDQLENSAIEITLVGDIDIEDSINAVAQTFGTLALREEQPRPYTEAREISFPEPGLETLIHNGDPNQAVLQMYWPTVDYSNTSTSAKLDLLSSLLSGRIREAVREELGASYAPGVFNLEDANFRNFGYFAVSLDAKTADIEVLSQVVRNEIDMAINEGFTEDEINRTRQPLIARTLNAEKTNPYWFNRLIQAQTSTERLGYQPIIIETYKSTTGDELQALAAEYLLSETVFEVRVVPGSPL